MSKVWRGMHFYLLMILAIFIVTGCNGGSTTSSTTSNQPYVQSIALQVTNTNLVVGLPQTLTVLAQYNTGKVVTLPESNVSYKSNNPAITIANNGVITATAAADNSIVTATYNGLTNSIAVSATVKTLTSITLVAGSTSIPVGAITPVRGVVTFNDGTTQTLGTYPAGTSVTNSNPEAVAIESTDTAVSLKGVGEGSSNISVTFNSVTSNILPITVNAATIVSVNVIPAARTLPNGTYAQLSATATYNNGQTVDITDNPDTLWSSSSDDVTVNANGKFGAILANTVGSATVTAQFDGQSASSNVTVTNATLVSTYLSSTYNFIPQGITSYITLTGVYSDSTTQPIDASNYILTSSSPVINVVQKTIEGVPTWVATSTVPSGSSLITAENNNPNYTINSSITLSANPAIITGIGINTTATNIIESSGQQFTAVAYTSDGNKYNTADVLWTSESIGVISINSGGFAVANGLGNTTITASSLIYPTLESSVNVTVGNYYVYTTNANIQAGNSNGGLYSCQVQAQSTGSIAHVLRNCGQTVYNGINPSVPPYYPNVYNTLTNYSPLAIGNDGYIYTFNQLGGGNNYFANGFNAFPINSDGSLGTPESSAVSGDVQTALCNQSSGICPNYLINSMAIYESYLYITAGSDQNGETLVSCQVYAGNISNCAVNSSIAAVNLQTGISIDNNTGIAYVIGNNGGYQTWAVANGVFGESSVAMNVTDGFAQSPGYDNIAFVNGFAYFANNAGTGVTSCQISESGSFTNCNSASSELTNLSGVNNVYINSGTGYVYLTSSSQTLICTLNSAGIINNDCTTNSVLFSGSATQPQTLGFAFVSGQ